jgi:hypothetical protein
MAMAAMNMVSGGGFRGVSFNLKRCPQGSPLYFARKPPFLGPDDQLDHLAVFDVSLRYHGSSRIQKEEERREKREEEKKIERLCLEGSLNECQFTIDK